MRTTHTLRRRERILSQRLLAFLGVIIIATDFCRPYIGADSDSGYSPPPQIFKKEARAAQLFAPLFSFDRFRLYSLLYFGEYSRKRSNFFAHSCEYHRTTHDCGKRTKLFSTSDESGHPIRAPPRKSDFLANSLSDFRR